MSTALTTIGAVALAAWVYLLLLRGFFWLPRTLAPRACDAHPAVVALVPARDEADGIAQAVASLLAQDYRGSFRVVLIDDHSSDGTAALAREAAQRAGASDRLAVVEAASLPPGWTGKLWALNEGVAAVERGDAPPDLYLLTDADIAHDPANLSTLVATLEAEGRDMVSLMVRLRCEDRAERFLIPAFVFFFAMLYPFAWAADPKKRTAAAAGGCVLLRRDALSRVGGFAAIRSALIDDCALARAVKDGGGRIRIALARKTQSLRPYPRVADIWAMVARTAYAQLRHSPLILAATIAGLLWLYLAPPLLLFAGGAPALLGLAAWALMALAYAPMLRFYGLSFLRAPLLPLVATIYLGATLDSARRHYAGTGGAWKGRVEWQSQR